MIFTGFLIGISAVQALMGPNQFGSAQYNPYHQPQQQYQAQPQQFYHPQQHQHQHQQQPYQGFPPMGVTGPFQTGTPSCDSQPFQCAGRTIMCTDTSCTYDCTEPGSCVNTKFLSSPITEDLKVHCKKLNACSGVKVLSSAITTSVQCDDNSCYGMKVQCVGNKVDQCKFECSNNGCASPGGLRVPPNELVCAGNVRQCLMKASPRGSFINGKFTCAVRPGGNCLLECADSTGEVSCRGTKFNCLSKHPGACSCQDRRTGNLHGMPFMPPYFPGQPPMPPAHNPGPGAPFPGFPKVPLMRDCPAIIYPKPKNNTNATTTIKPL